jgi:putative transposase
MSRGERQALVDRADPQLSIVRQCQLLKVARSTLYYQPAPVSDDDLAGPRCVVVLTHQHRDGGCKAVRENGR